MTELLHPYNTSDIVCFVTLVFTRNYTAYPKKFADWLAPLKNLLITKQNGNNDPAGTKLHTQYFIVIANCSFPGEINFKVVKVSFACCKYFLEIYCSCSKLLKTKIDDIKHIIDKYLSVVEQEEREKVTGDVLEETRVKQDMFLMSVIDYVKYIEMG